MLSPIIRIFLSSDPVMSCVGHQHPGQNDAEVNSDVENGKLTNQAAAGLENCKSLSAF